MKKLLIIEDDLTFAQSLARVFKNRDYDCHLAFDKKAALQLAKNIKPQYVLLDLNLGEDSGHRLIKPILRISPISQIVILTGYATVDSAVKAMKQGAKDYLTKPAKPAHILNAFLKCDEKQSLEEITHHHISLTLKKHHGNITHTAKTLGMHRRTLQRKLKRIEKEL